MKIRNGKLRTIILIVIPLLFWAAILSDNSPFGLILRSFGRGIHSGNAGQAFTIQNEVKNTNTNYGADIDKYAQYFGLPPAYFKALAIMECSGNKPAGSRYEPHVYKNLKDLQEGKISEYNGIIKEDIADASDESLKSLATSWGPFQLMGYQCIKMDIPLQNIRGENAVFWGMKWIDTAYGSYLREERYQDAFHIHNTGLEFPEDGSPATTNPHYAQNGVTLMEYF